MAILIEKKKENTQLPKYVVKVDTTMDPTHIKWI